MENLNKKELYKSNLKMCSLVIIISLFFSELIKIITIKTMLLAGLTLTFSSWLFFMPAIVTAVILTPIMIGLCVGIKKEQ